MLGGPWGSCPSRGELAVSIRVGSGGVLHPGGSRCVADPRLCLACFFPHLFPK